MLSNLGESLKSFFLVFFTKNSQLQLFYI